MTTPFVQHPGRGRFNAAFFRALGPFIEWTLGPRKRRLFAGLPDRVVELGPGVGANLRYLRPGSTLVAIEPNRAMHAPLHAAATRFGIRLYRRDSVAERTDLPGGEADVVLSTLVLCSVTDPAAALDEIRRLLRPGGTFRFLEHVAAPEGTITRALQRALRRPWRWLFEGCSCERDLERTIRDAGFASVQVERYRIRSPFVPFNTQIAGVAVA